MTLTKNLVTDLIGNLVPDLIRVVDFVEPTDVPNNVIWLDTSDGSTVTESSNKISQVDDKSGQGNDAVQVTPANQPDLIVGHLNAMDTMSFNGSSQYFDLPGNIISGTSGRTFFFVARADSMNTNQALLGLTDSTANGARYDIAGQSTLPVAVRISSASKVFFEGIVDFTGTTYFVLTIQNAPNSDLINTSGWINGVPMTQLSGISKIINTDTTGFTTIGRSSSIIDYFDGNIAEFAAFDRDLSSSERISLENSFINKWAI